MTPIEGLLLMVRSYPSLCDPLGESELSIAARVAERVDHERMCLACGQIAVIALVADTVDGRRWVDLCMQDYADVLQIAPTYPYPLRGGDDA